MLILLCTPTHAKDALNVSPDEVARYIGVTDNRYSQISDFVMSIVDWILGFFGLQHDETVVITVYALVVFGISIIVGLVAKWIILGVVRQISARVNLSFYKALTSNRFFTKICRIIPALVFLVLIQFTLTGNDQLASILSKTTLIYVVVVAGVALSALIMAIWQHVDARENKRKLPLNGLSQLAKGIVWIVAAIIIVCIIIDKSPASLLAGLGAFAAVLMLVFKDSILGLVAGVQLSENDSLHEGDWIKVDGTDANGRVVEVNLTSVKVLNWDKTTTSLPPYSLISGSFTNYRSMQESNTRRICRSYYIDADSVLPATPEMLQNISSIPFMNDYISRKLAQRKEGKVADVDNPDGLVDGTIDTNLGLFRAYFKMWLDACPYISHTDDCFVSTLEQTASGIPFQVYCFTATSRWFPYEAIQDLVFEHLASMLWRFQLYAYENPSSRDTVTSGYFSNPGSKVDELFGIPYPFFQDPDAPDSPRSTCPTPKAPAASPALSAQKGIETDNQ